tara:strand:- start:270 stop:533 length:264 start_codon:yes stop_codon:yes gene_type:complete
MIKRIFHYIKRRWKTVLAMLLCLVSGTILAYTTYYTGFEFGRIVGHCELACSVLEAEFSGFEYEGTCQCEQYGGFILNIPIDHSFFD